MTNTMTNAEITALVNDMIKAFERIATVLEQMSDNTMLISKKVNMLTEFLKETRE